MNEGAADVDITRGGPEQGGNDAIHEYAGSGDDHHQPGLHLHRFAEPMDGSDGDPDGDHDQGQRVEKGSQDAGALITKGLLIGGRAGLEVNRDKRKQQRQKVGDVVPGLRDKGQRMSTYPGKEGKRHIGQRRQQRDA